MYNYMPELRCNRPMDIPGIWSNTHYFKSLHGYSRGQSYYVEEAIFMPFKVTNHFVNHDTRKSYCVIEKLVPKYPDVKDIIPSMAHLQKWKEAVQLPYILEIKSFHHMKERLKSIIIFS
jgi:hypothetical protein